VPYKADQNEERSCVKGDIEQKCNDPEEHPGDDEAQTQHNEVFCHDHLSDRFQYPMRDSSKHEVEAPSIGLASV